MSRLNIYYSYDPRPARVEAAELHYRQALEIDSAMPEANLAKAFILGARRRISRTPRPSRRWKGFGRTAKS
jgi:hypothetical protein